MPQWVLFIFWSFSQKLKRHGSRFPPTSTILKLVTNVLKMLCFHRDSLVPASRQRISGGCRWQTGVGTRGASKSRSDWPHFARSASRASRCRHRQVVRSPKHDLTSPLPGTEPCPVPGCCWLVTVSIITTQTDCLPCQLMLRHPRHTPPTHAPFQLTLSCWTTNFTPILIIE